MNTLINFIEQPNGDFRVEHYNGVYMGDLSRAHDFHYNFWPAALNGGFWPGYLLKALSDKLEELNAPIDAELEAWYEEYEKQMASCTHPNGIDPEDGCLDCGFYAK